MDFTIDLILFTAIGFLFIFIVASHFILSRLILLVLSILFSMNLDVYHEVLKLSKVEKELKRMKRKQTVAQSRERKILKTTRKIDRKAWWV